MLGRPAPTSRRHHLAGTVEQAPAAIFDIHAHLVHPRQGKVVVGVDHPLAGRIDVAKVVAQLGWRALVQKRSYQVEAEINGYRTLRIDKTIAMLALDGRQPIAEIHRRLIDAGNTNASLGPNKAPVLSKLYPGTFRLKRRDMTKKMPE